MEFTICSQIRFVHEPVGTATSSSFAGFPVSFSCSTSWSGRGTFLLIPVRYPTASCAQIHDNTKYEYSKTPINGAAIPLVFTTLYNKSSQKSLNINRMVAKIDQPIVSKLVKPSFGFLATPCKQTKPDGQVPASDRLPQRWMSPFNIWYTRSANEFHSITIEFWTAIQFTYFCRMPVNATIHGSMILDSWPHRLDHVHRPGSMRPYKSANQ